VRLDHLLSKELLTIAPVGGVVGGPLAQPFVLWVVARGIVECWQMRSGLDGPACLVLLLLLVGVWNGCGVSGGVVGTLLGPEGTRARWCVGLSLVCG
jgi:hypothetical protein